MVLWGDSGFRIDREGMRTLFEMFEMEDVIDLRSVLRCHSRIYHLKYYMESSGRIKYSQVSECQ